LETIEDRNLRKERGSEEKKGDAQSLWLPVKLLPVLLSKQARVFLNPIYLPFSESYKVIEWGKDIQNNYLLAKRVRKPEKLLMRVGLRTQVTFTPLSFNSWSMSKKDAIFSNSFQS